MMYAVFLSLLVAVLAIEDLRKRELTVLWLAVFAAMSAVTGVVFYGLAGTAMNMAANILLLVYLAGGVLLYIRLRRGRWLWREYIGMGDVVFLLAAAPLFDLRSYLLFLLGASVFSLLWWVVSRSRTIPFVATSGVVLIITLFI